MEVPKGAALNHESHEVGPLGCAGSSPVASALFRFMGERKREIDEGFRSIVRSIVRESLGIDDFSNVRFDAEEVANFVTEYIKRNKLAEEQANGVFWKYWLPMEAKHDFEDIGFNLFSVESILDPQSADYGKQCVVVKSWPKVD